LFAYVLLLIIILLSNFIILFLVLRRQRGSSSSPEKLKKKQSSDDGISEESCEILGGIVRDNRCVVITVEKDGECITDLGRII